MDSKTTNYEASMDESAYMKRDNDKEKTSNEDNSPKLDIYAREEKLIADLEAAGLPYTSRRSYYKDEYGRCAMFYDPKTRVSSPKVAVGKHRQVSIQKVKGDIVFARVYQVNFNITSLGRNVYQIPLDHITIPSNAFKGKKAAPGTPPNQPESSGTNPITNPSSPGAALQNQEDSK